MKGVVFVELKIKEEEVYPAYIMLGAIVERHKKKLEEDGQANNKSINALGIKGLGRILNELELNLEV